MKANLSIDQLQYQNTLLNFEIQQLKCDVKSAAASARKYGGIVRGVARLVRPNRGEKTEHAVQRLLEENQSLKAQLAEQGLS